MIFIGIYPFINNENIILIHADHVDYIRIYADFFKILVDPDFYFNKWFCVLYSWLVSLFIDLPYLLPGLCAGFGDEVIT